MVQCGSHNARFIIIIIQLPLTVQSERGHLGKNQRTRRREDPIGGRMLWASSEREVIREFAPIQRGIRVCQMIVNEQSVATPAKDPLVPEWRTWGVVSSDLKVSLPVCDLESHRGKQTAVANPSTPPTAPSTPLGADSDDLWEPRPVEVSGLPFVCNNCGVSFYSLQLSWDDVECYCSGECKWSVIMYREMDRRMHESLHRQQPIPQHNNSTVSVHDDDSLKSTYTDEEDDDDDAYFGSYSSMDNSDKCW